MVSLRAVLHIVGWLKFVPGIHRNFLFNVKILDEILLIRLKTIVHFILIC